MLTGVGLVSTLAASIAAYFVRQEKGEDLKSLAERLDRIERLLQQRDDTSPAGLRLPDND